MREQRFSFHRPELAVDFCKSLEGKGLTDASSGLFLTAPRRTGKSTFLRQDLVPAMEHSDYMVIYVDLWSDRSSDPAILIASAIREVIRSRMGFAHKAASKVGVSKIKLAGSIEIDINKIGMPDGVTLSDAFSYLSGKTKKSIALIIDEAQHALTSKEGINAMFALKAARDRQNQGRSKNRLYLVMTGSHRDKLAHLVLKKDQPFFGSQITSFPLLGKDFTDAYTDWVNRQLAQHRHFGKKDMFRAFEIVGHRPEILKSLVKEIALDFDSNQIFTGKLSKGAQIIREKLWAEIESDLSSLTDIQQAVLEVIVRTEKGFSPFTEESMNSYRAILSNVDISPQTVQAALEGLREKNLVWKSARGSYALEDASIAECFLHKRIKNRGQK